MKPDTTEILISADEIREMVARVADDINRDYGDRPLLVIPVLTGAFIFAADLVRLLKMPIEIDFMKVSSYVPSTFAACSTRPSKRFTPSE